MVIRFASECGRHSDNCQSYSCKDCFRLVHQYILLTTLQTQRDVGLRVPINFHTVPAVSLTQACFSNNQYEHNAFQKCFSNLLGVGFRRFAVDTYWDPLRSIWSLCPVELPASAAVGNDGIVPIRSGVSIQISTDVASAKIPESTAPQLGQSLGFDRRQDRSSAATPTIAPSGSASISASASSRTSSAKPTVISYPTNNGPPLLQVGKYNCTTSLTLEFLTGILEDFLEVTSTTTGAAILLLTLNIHAASSILNPDAPAPRLSQPQLPVSGSLLNDVLKGNLTEVTYTPVLLRQQQSNLNETWLNVDWSNRPAQGYYKTSTNAAGQQTTADGWPNEAYVEFQKLYRLVTSYGTVDPQMQLYNIGPDLDFMFPPLTLTDVHQTSIDSSGLVSSGCLFDASDRSVTTERNSSWAVTMAPPLSIEARPDLAQPISSITNITSCGLTPYLNQTLGGATADKNPLPYAAFQRSTLWTWAPGEPLNVTAENDPNGNRCVVMMTSPYAGRWQASNCATRRRAACHNPSQPYEWHLSNDTTDYRNAGNACRSPFVFSVPHTSLENAHLLRALQNNRENAQESIFVDLNSINVPDCWVLGLNGTCPYLPTSGTSRTRIVVVPTVAAVIIFVVAAFTFFVKCAANRRENKRGRRRKMVDGWEYEGVPS